jgi:hypothetical protein
MASFQDYLYLGDLFNSNTIEEDPQEPYQLFDIFGGGVEAPASEKRWFGLGELPLGEFDLGEGYFEVIPQDQSSDFMFEGLI